MEVCAPGVEIIQFCSIDTEDGGFGGVGFEELEEFFLEMSCCGGGSVTWKVQLFDLFGWFFAVGTGDCEGIFWDTNTAAAAAAVVKRRGRRG